jgi:hypothetical protein
MDPDATTEWSIELTFRLEHTQPADEVSTDLVDVLSDLGALGPVVSMDRGAVSARFNFTDAPAVETVQRGRNIMIAALDKVGLKARELEHVDLSTLDHLDQELMRPAESYVGVSEIAEILGVSKQRVSELRSTHAAFPVPVAELAAGPVWSLSTLQRFIANWPRKSGRPRKNTIDDAALNPNSATA